MIRLTPAEFAKIEMTRGLGEVLAAAQAIFQRAKRHPE
jgi:hypothetical protein